MASSGGRRGEVQQEGEEEDPTTREQPDDASLLQFSVSPPNTTFTVVKASEIYPKPNRLPDESVASGDDSPFVPPFVELPGEGVKFRGHTRDSGTIVVTNYRLNVTPVSADSAALINVPLGLVEGVELRELFYIQVACKDGKCFRIAFDNSGSAEEWHRRLCDAVALPSRVDDVFALAHYAWAKETGFEELERPQPTHSANGLFDAEIDRLRFDLGNTWRVSKVNEGHKLCSTYPESILVPHSITDDDLSKVALFRSARRVPSIVWRHAGTGAVLARCSQPEVGWLGWRSNEDERLVQAIAEACSVDGGTGSSGSSVVDENIYSNGFTHGETNSIKDLSREASRIGEVKKVLIIDARSYAAAVGNRARGGGVECQEYYPNAEILFMNLANIHSIRKSFLQLRSLCSSSTDHASWFHALDATKWFSHISGLLKAAVRCATALDREGRPVIVHCSDGWDRTPQIVSLAELLLDPYYRTIEGFQVLIEREWLSYGHKMADRCGNAFATSDTNERSPIFLQWLDCVHQLLHQFPCHFGFNFSYLVKLAQHVYSNLFGNFLCNSMMERKHHHLFEKTRSLWGYMRLNTDQLRNFLYDDDDGVIWPKTEVRDLLLWQDIYVSDLRCWPAFPEVSLGNGATSISVGNGGVNMGGSKSGCASDSDSWENSREGSENGEVKHQDGKDEEEDEVPGNIKMSDTSKEKVVANSSEPSYPINSDCQSKKPHQAERRIKAEKTSQHLVRGNIESSTDTLVPEEDQPVKSKERGSTTVAASEDQHVLPQNGHDSHGVEFLSSAKVRTLSDYFHPMTKPLGMRKLVRYPIDSDGLISHDNKPQQRLREIIFGHQTEIQLLRRDLHLTRLALSRHQGGHTAAGGLGQGADKERLESLLVMSNGQFGQVDYEDSSGVQTGSTASDVSSWEAVDEKEAKQTLWIPDHALAACMRCHTTFWFGRRKHHCRSCGGLYCSECSNRFVPMPTEHLYHPVRICDECFVQQESSAPPPGCEGDEVDFAGLEVPNE